ncbi:E3 SUMO-protein ligase NSE2 [Podarcis raffonei]|uniref:E3 SUMO-protein ligase NSE2 n=1 Tax=Podarcis raffonei TaxID=65483 RepID=UPI00232944A3|nr:E3 SUMO-protein ligase NSE2 [Podarcis raffonei]XP_053251297.1 E3 SUMO-protein ligase NSE2 [Podarcis raffonei]XP_053251298.1 E3 SUMO-protein ligase NSE2 [Podarcis raffonei]
MSGRSVVSYSAVDACLSSLKTCQSNISTGMDIATTVALDLVESKNDMKEVDEMERVMLEYAAMSREMNHYMEAVEDTVNQLKRDKPETLPDLKNVVEEKFEALESGNSDLDLQGNEKYVHFKEQLRQMKAQFGVQSDGEKSSPLEQVDEDLAVTQSQMNFVCPITQVEMKKPVKNKVCGHFYEEEAILDLIRRKEHRGKNACCPKVGCSNLTVRRSDLVPDEAVKRAIDSQSKQSRSTQ